MKTIKHLMLLVVAVITLASCQTVSPGHKGVEISWGGETNLNMVYPEGMNTGLHWVWDDMIEYDVREKTMVKKFEFNDKNNMTTAVEIALDFNLAPDKVNILHTQITDVETKIIKTLKSAGKEVVPQYSAVELNISKRMVAEQQLSQILQDELPEFYVNFVRLQLTDVDLPKTVADMAERTAEQLERNKLAEKLEAEKTAKAKALVAEAKGQYEAAEYEAKAKKILSQPAMLELKRLENDAIWANKGVSPYGSGNVFGDVGVIKGLK